MPPMLGGGLCTTLNDYIHFLSMIYHEGTYEGKRILTAETVKEMQANQVRMPLFLPGIHGNSTGTVAYRYLWIGRMA